MPDGTALPIALALLAVAAWLSSSAFDDWGNFVVGCAMIMAIGAALAAALGNANAATYGLTSPLFWENYEIPPSAQELLQ